MRTLAIVVLSVALATCAAGQTVEVPRFVPAAPDSRSAITAKVSGTSTDLGGPRCATASVAGRAITIVAGCIAFSGATAPSAWTADAFIGQLQPGVYDVQLRRERANGPLMSRSSLIVQEATPAFDVVPNVGAANAAERVRLIGRNIGCPAEVLCAEPVVRFGDQTVAIQAAGEDFLEVQPLRGSGTVDVTVTRGSNVIRRVAAFHFFDAGQRPAPEFFTPVLFPTLFSSRGAFGSEWDSELSIRNDNDFPIIAPYALPFPQFPFRNSTQVVSAKAAGLSASGGRLVYVPRRGDHDIHFGLLVRDLSRQGEALGVEVPVVREDDFYEDAFTLMNVPSDSRSRVALRVYALSEMRTVRMRVRTMDAVTPLVNIPVGLSGFAELGQDHFSVAINDLIGAYPVLAGKGALRIEIAPEAGPSARGAHRLWAFASVTNNATQHVTIISPQ